MKRRLSLPHGPGAEPWLPRRDTTVLLLSASTELQGAVGRVSAAAAVELLVGEDFKNAAGRWDEVAAVLVDAALTLDESVEAGLTGWRGPTTVVGFTDSSARMWRQAERLGADRVAILPDSAAWLADYLGRLRNPMQGAGVIGIVGGCGGAGASTLAILLSAEAARCGTRTLLVDGDPWGGGLATALSAQELPGLRWPELLRASGSINPEQLAASLPQLGGLSLLSWPDAVADIWEIPGQATSGATQWEPLTTLFAEAPTNGLLPAETARSVTGEVLRAARGAYGLVVVDVGRSLQSLSSLARHCSGLLIVVPPRLRAAAAARQLVETLPPVPMTAVVRGPLGEGIDATMVAEAVGMPLMGRLPELRRVEETMASKRVPDLLRRRRVSRLLQGILGWMSGQRYDVGTPVAPIRLVRGEDVADGRDRAGRGRSNGRPGGS